MITRFLKTKPKQALVVGPYRAKNFGDDLVGAILATHLQRRGYSVCIPRLSRANSGWLDTQYAESYEGLFATADIVVVGGGGIMSDTSGAQPGASYLDIVVKARMSGDLTTAPIFVTSVGAGPWLVERSRILSHGVSLIAEKVGVRERESYEHLRSLGVTENKLVLGADLALLTPDLLNFTAAPNGKLGMQFDVNAFDDVKQNPQLTAIIDAAQQYASGHADEVVLVRNGKTKSELAATAPDAETLSYLTLADFLPRLAGMRGLFTSHLHLAIASYSMRIPTFSMYVREKTRRFYEQIGRPERAIDLRFATLDDFNRLIEAAETATWTDQDETMLQHLKHEARKLLEFVR